MSADTIEYILKSINAGDEIYWRLISTAARLRDRELLELADRFRMFTDAIFKDVAELKRR